MIVPNCFDNLFVLEMTNNHLGSLARGLKIIEEHAKIIKAHKVKAAIKLQFRDIDTFIHKNYTERFDIQYIKRIMDTRLTKSEYYALVEAIRESGCIPLATPFDEKSVDLCEEFKLPIIKIASADSNDWRLIERIARTSKPVIASTGGLDAEGLDNLVFCFEKIGVPLAINHCISAYPAEDKELQLNQIDYLRKKYPSHTIGFSSHEYRDWTSSIMIAYAKGARLFERHIDINTDGKPISAYSSLPEQIDIWLDSYHKVIEMCGFPPDQRTSSNFKEIEYINSHIRGLYARTDLNVGEILTFDNTFLALPLINGQISSRDSIPSCVFGKKVKRFCRQDDPILFDTLIKN